MKRKISLFLVSILTMSCMMFTLNAFAAGTYSWYIYGGYAFYGKVQDLSQTKSSRTLYGSTGGGPMAKSLSNLSKLEKSNTKMAKVSATFSIDNKTYVTLSTVNYKTGSTITQLSASRGRHANEEDSSSSLIRKTYTYTADVSIYGAAEAINGSTSYVVYPAVIQV